MKRRNHLAILLAAALAVGSLGSVSAQGDTTAVTTITMNANAITVDGAGASAVGSLVTISAAGTYSLSGALADGQVVVNTQDTEPVNLIFSGVEIKSADGAAVDFQSAEAVTIDLADGTQNVITSGAVYAESEDALNAAIFSTSDVTIKGSGSLTVEADAVDGIASSASLTIEDTPVVTIHAGDDAIQLATNFTMTGGELSLVAGGGSGSTLADTLSGKGLKVEENVAIEGGSITIDAADDAIRSEKDLVINDGTFVITATGKAIHASYNLEINDGSITVLASDEGIEGGFITLNGGNIVIKASDDGINVSEPDDLPAPTLYYLHINGGTVVVDADGDGLDSNGSIVMTGGVVIVNGPTANDNGALDFDGTFDITGGVLIASGSSGMATAPGETSTQNSVLIAFDSAMEAGTLVHIQTSSGDDVLTFAPSKTFQSIVLSSPELVAGTSYTVYTGGSSTATATDGLYADGTYTPGTEQDSFTISAVTTQVGTVSGPMGGRP